MKLFNRDKKEKEFEVPEFSMLELYKVNWTKFGEQMKTNQIIEHQLGDPEEVTVGLDSHNRPYAKVVFPWENTTIMVYQDYAKFHSERFWKENGNQQVSELWEEFKPQARQDIVDYQHKVEIEHNMGVFASAMVDEYGSHELLNMAGVREEEKLFLNAHNNDKYQFFEYQDGNPCFIKLGGKKNDSVVDVCTPKELEFCVARLIPQEKLYQINDIDFFRTKCKDLQKKYPYFKEDWELTTNLLVEVLLRSKEEYAKQQNDKQYEKQ